MVRLFGCFCAVAALAAAQAQQAPSSQNAPGTLVERQPVTTNTSTAFTIAPGTHIPLSVIKSISTRDANVGDRIYLQTAFPVSANGRIVIPEGSWVTGTVTSVKRPQRKMKSGELQVRFDSIVLPNGVSRDFNSDLGALDSRDNEKLNREKGTVSGSSSGKVAPVIVPTVTGAGLGTVIGAAKDHPGAGLGIGSAAGAAVGLGSLLVRKGNDATLNRGSVLEMVLDRPLQFSENELDFRNAPPRGAGSDGSRPAGPATAGWPRTPF